MALDVMGLIGPKDRLQEISVRLEESHLAYLQLDDSPAKIQARRKLEGYIKEYLCHVPNERKYVFQETADILHRSAATVKDFSGYRACTAWSAISLYAANLLAQPWRKEYRTLRTYSGYYKHEIEANLVGAEIMFELMGYKHTGLGVLALEGPIDPDKVSSVSRDAIVAFVECQIMKEIWESVSIFFTISWLEVLEFRWNFVGTSEQAIRALKFRFLERMNHITDKMLAPTYRDYRIVPPPGIDDSQTSFPNKYHTPYVPNVSKPENFYPSDGNFSFPSIESSNVSNRFPTNHACAAPSPKFFSTSGTTIGNSTTQTIPGRAARVPTARLIEFDAPLPVANYEKNFTIPNSSTTKSVKSRNVREIDETDHRRNQRFRDNERPYYARIEKKSSRKNDDDDEETMNDWDIVYKSLENSGYSKDLGQRDDVLRKPDFHGDTKNSSKNFQRKITKSPVNVENDERYEKYGKKNSSATMNLRETNFNDETFLFPNNSENRFREIVSSKKKLSSDLLDSSLSLGDVGTEKMLIGNERTSKKYSNTLPAIARQTTKHFNDTSSTSKNVEIRDNVQKDDRVVELRWNCGFCTFLNVPGREICEMCGKSRRKGNEDKPLASGGKECPQCTLVNEKNASTCEACSASLKDSPTYI